MGRRGGGRGGGRGGRGGSFGGDGGGGGASDQYGESMASQDRGGFNSSAGRGGGSMTGGGEAGGSTKGPDISVTKHIPKFLQVHSHLLHKGGKPDEPHVVREENDSDIEDYDGGALEHAMLANPALAAQYPELQRKANKAKAVDEKGLGNRAFAAKDFPQAVVHFSKCIELDLENEVYYSNRSAAHAAMKRWDEALRDGKRAVQLKPSWAKGFVRVGGAYFGMELWCEAKEAYQMALDLEPDDTHLRAAYDKADIQERKVVEARRHKFKGKGFGGLRDPQGAKRERPEATTVVEGPQKSKQRPDKQAKPAKAQLLSFAAEDDDS